MKRWLPQSMAGQILALVAVALLVAQAVNLIWLYRASHVQIVTETAGAAMMRGAAQLAWMERQAERKERGLLLPREMRNQPAEARGMIRSENLLPDDAKHYRDMEKRGVGLLRQNGVDVRDVEIVRVDELPMAMVKALPRRFRDMIPDEEFQPMDGFLIVALQAPDQRWTHVALPLRRQGQQVFGTLLFQTMILYFIVLLPLIWFTRRLSQPLHDLTIAAQVYQPGKAKAIIDEEGPPDTRDLISAFNAMQQRVDAMVDEKDVMLGAIGHDLRTPLASLRVRVECVDDDAERMQMVATITEIDNMLDDILSLARVGRAKGMKEPTNLAALVETIADEYGDLGEPVSVADSPRTVAPVQELMIRRVLRNLISNALKYGGVARLSVEQADGMALVHIDDDGPGLPEGKIEQMFEPFKRAEESRNRATGGSGLGLTLARAISRDHGGDIVLANRAEGGLRATLSLPMESKT